MRSITECKTLDDMRAHLKRDPDAKVNDFAPHIQRYIKIYGYANIREQIGLPRRVDRHSVASDKSAEEALSKVLCLFRSGEIKSGVHLRQAYSALYHVVTKKYGPLNRVLEMNGITAKYKTPADFDSDADLLEIVKRAHHRKNRIPKNQREYIEKRFGSVDNAKVVCGIPVLEKVEQVSLPLHKLTALLNKEISICKGPKYTKADFIKTYPQYSESMKKYCISDIFSDSGYHPYDTPKVAVQWSKNNLTRFILDLIKRGEHLNYTSAVIKYRGAVDAARRLFGGWSIALEACGINYDSILIDTNLSSFVGRKFEQLIADILKDSGIPHQREPEINNCHPDFVLEDGTWIDAKLSLWTANLQDCGTIGKYEPHTDRLIITYLRGGNNYKIVSNTLLVPARYFLRKLPPDKVDYYSDRLVELESML